MAREFIDRRKSRPHARPGSTTGSETWEGMAPPASQHTHVAHSMVWALNTRLHARPASSTARKSCNSPTMLDRDETRDHLNTHIISNKSSRARADELDLWGPAVVVVLSCNKGQLCTAQAGAPIHHEQGSTEKDVPGAGCVPESTYSVRGPSWSDEKCLPSAPATAMRTQWPVGKAYAVGSS